MRLSLLGLVAASFLLPFLPACSGNPDEKAIRAIIEGMRVTAEAKKFDETVAPLASDYHDNFNRNPAELKDRLDRLFRDYDRLIIKAPIEKLERQTVSATVRARLNVLGVAGGRKQYLFGNPLSGAKVQVDLEKRQGRWWVVAGQVQH